MNKEKYPVVPVFLVRELISLWPLLFTKSRFLWSTKVDQLPHRTLAVCLLVFGPFGNIQHDVQDEIQCNRSDIIHFHSPSASDWCPGGCTAIHLEFFAMVSLYEVHNLTPLFKIPGTGTQIHYLHISEERERVLTLAPEQLLLNPLPVSVHYWVRHSMLFFIYVFATNMKNIIKIQ